MNVTLSTTDFLWHFSLTKDSKIYLKKFSHMNFRLPANFDVDVPYVIPFNCSRILNVYDPQCFVQSWPINENLWTFCRKNIFEIFHNWNFTVKFKTIDCLKHHNHWYEWSSDNLYSGKVALKHKIEAENLS